MSNKIDNEESEIHSSNRYYESKEFYLRVMGAKQEFREGKSITFTMEELEVYIHELVGKDPS